MMKLTSLIMFVLVPAPLLACPACAGGSPGEASKFPYTLVILSTFILLTYIPFYLLFRAAKKYEPKE